MSPSYILCFLVFILDKSMTWGAIVHADTELFDSMHYNERYKNSLRCIRTMYYLDRHNPSLCIISLLLEYPPYGVLVR